MRTERVAVTTPTAKQFWEARVAKTPNAPAVSSGERTWSYCEFDAWAATLACGLREQGVGRGTLVATLLPTSARLLRLQVAIIKLGAVAVPMIAGSTAAETRHVLSHSGSELLITDGSGWRVAQDAGAHELRLGVFVEGEDATPPARSAELLEQASAIELLDPGTDPLEPMAIMYTSGSTGAPKGVIQPSASLATTGDALAEALELDSDDVVLCALPLFHTAATHMAFASAVAAGARLELMDRFSRGAFWPLARSGGTTATFMFPSQLAILMSEPPSPVDRDNALRVCFSHIRNEAFCERFGVDVCAGWAMTETCGMGTVLRPGSGDPPAGQVGRPYPDDARVRICDADGSELAPGERGEIWFSHRHVMSGYHRDPESTAATLRDGWVGSGDVGSIDEDGILYFHGRVKHVIKRSGENIAGEEVEFVLMAHPDVEEAIVCGVPDAIRTEEVHATVRLREDRAIGPAELASWCAERISAWKVPRYITLAGEPLPRLANGKPDRSLIRAQVAVEQAWQSDGSQASGR
jgi:crotonobetaine/carnitine-CoA ligase